MSSVVPQGYRRVGENRIRENVGRGLADFVVGQVIEHRPARTVTETDHMLMLALTGNQAPVHSDTMFCERSGRDRPLVCGIVTLGIVLGATVRSLSGLTTASLALDELRLDNPVHVGDTHGDRDPRRPAVQEPPGTRRRDVPNHRLQPARPAGHHLHPHVPGPRRRTPGPRHDRLLVNEEVGTCPRTSR